MRKIILPSLSVKDKVSLSSAQKDHMYAVYRDDKETRKALKARILALVDRDDVNSIEKYLPLFDKVYFGISIAIILSRAVRNNSTSVHDYVTQTVSNECYKYALVSDIDDEDCDGDYLRELCESIFILGSNFDIRGITLDKVMTRLDDPKLLRELIDKQIISHKQFDVRYLGNCMTWSDQNLEIWLEGCCKDWVTRLLLICFGLYQTNKEKFNKKLHILLNKYGKVDKKLLTIYQILKKQNEMMPELNVKPHDPLLHLKGIDIEGTTRIVDGTSRFEFDIPDTYSTASFVMYPPSKVNFVEDISDNEGVDVENIIPIPL